MWDEFGFFLLSDVTMLLSPLSPNAKVLNLILVTQILQRLIIQDEFNGAF